MIGMLKKGRVDLVISSDDVISKAIKQAGYLTLKTVKIGVVFSSKPSIAMSLTTPKETIQKIKQAYLNLKNQHNICDLISINPSLCTL
jgi:hypothetical protein